eukprot:5355647-Prymnesium_polylepis.1
MASRAACTVRRSCARRLSRSRARAAWLWRRRLRGRRGRAGGRARPRSCCVEPGDRAPPAPWGSGFARALGVRLRTGCRPRARWVAMHNCRTPLSPSPLVCPAA